MEKYMCLTYITLFCVCLFTNTECSNQCELESYFTGCPGHYANSRIKETRTESRRIFCALHCNKHMWCTGISVYHFEDHVKCDYHEKFFNVNCNSFNRIAGNVTLFLKKEEYKPLVNGCYNDGTKTGAVCTCSAGFAGDQCERYIRDCKEGKATGMTGYRLELIQPISAVNAFESLCYFDYGWTIILQRGDVGHNTQFNRTWNQYKYGFGKDKNLWIGLENLFLIVNQPGFTIADLQIYCESSAGGFSVWYDSFGIASEANDYAMTTGVFRANPGDEDSDGFGGSLSNVKFCTNDRPCSGYPSGQQGGWWYAAGKQGYALTNLMGTIEFLYRGQAFPTAIISVALL